MDIGQLQDEIKHLNFMLEDALTEAEVFRQTGDYSQLEACGIRISEISRRLQLRKKHLEDRINFSKIVHDLNKRGVICEVVKRYAHQSQSVEIPFCRT